MALPKRRKRPPGPRGIHSGAPLFGVPKHPLTDYLGAKLTRAPRPPKVRPATGTGLTGARYGRKNH